MVDQDLEILYKPATFHMRGRDVPYRELTVEEALLAEYHGQNIYDDLEDEFELSQEPVKKGQRQTKKKKVKEPTPEELLRVIARRIRDYMGTVLELTPEELESMTLTEFRRFRHEKDLQELRDQGFTDQEIKQLERESAKQNFRTAIGAIQEPSSTSTE